MKLFSFLQPLIGFCYRLFLSDTSRTSAGSIHCSATSLPTKQNAPVTDCFNYSVQNKMGALIIVGEKLLEDAVIFTLANNEPSHPANGAMSTLICLYKHDHGIKLMANPVQSWVKWIMEKQSAWVSVFLFFFSERSLKGLGKWQVLREHLNMTKYLSEANGVHPLFIYGRDVFVWPICSPLDSNHSYITGKTIF